MNTRKLRMAALVLAAGLSGAAQAALQGRDLNGSIDSFEAYYDTDLNITWLADANFGSGAMTWINANNWAANLSIIDSVNTITYDNWRLPDTLPYDASCSDTSYEYGCTGSEMGHLFYVEFGGVAGSSPRYTDNANFRLFDHIWDIYWSATWKYPSNAWVFDMETGWQAALSINLSGNKFRAWAVSDGDVGIAAIPEPETYVMMLAGLGLIVAAARRRRG